MELEFKMNVLEKLFVRFKALTQDFRPNSTKSTISSGFLILNPVFHFRAIEIHKLNYARNFFARITSINIIFIIIKFKKK